ASAAKFAGPFAVWPRLFCRSYSRESAQTISEFDPHKPDQRPSASTASLRPGPAKHAGSVRIAATTPDRDRERPLPRRAPNSTRSCAKVVQAVAKSEGTRARALTTGHCPCQYSLVRGTNFPEFYSEHKESGVSRRNRKQSFNRNNEP